MHDDAHHYHDCAVPVEKLSENVKQVLQTIMLARGKYECKDLKGWTRDTFTDDQASTVYWFDLAVHGSFVSDSTSRAT